MTSTAPPPELPERPTPPPPPAGSAAWPVWFVPAAFVAGVVITFVAGSFLALVVYAAGVEDAITDPPPGLVVAGTALQSLVFVAVAIGFARTVGPVRPVDFGLRGTPVWRAIGLLLATYFGFLLLAALWWSIVGLPDNEELLTRLGVEESTALLVFGALTVCVGAPVVEELFFRGFMYPALRNWRGPAIAAAITGTIFGVAHVLGSPAEQLVPLAIFGAGLCVLYERTGSLYPCIGLHAINNSIAFGSEVGWDWQIPLLTFGALGTCALVAGAAARRPRWV